MGVIDAFWAQVNLELSDLPRPWDLLRVLRAVDPTLYDRLVRGESWMMDPARTLEELEEGWRWWRRLYLEAIEATERETAR